MMRKDKSLFCLMMAMILAICPIAGCGSVNTISPADPATDDVPSHMISPADPATGDVPPLNPEDEFTVLFIGNSLTYAGKIPETFEALAQSSGKTVTVNQYTKPGYLLKEHVPELRDRADLCDSADAVVFQEGGIYYSYAWYAETLRSIKELQELFKPETKFYFLVTEIDITNDGQWDNYKNDLSQAENIAFIPSGRIHDLLIQNGYRYAQLHAENDFHPNLLYGYVAALTAYCVIYDSDCRGIEYGFPDDTFELMPGESKEEKLASNEEIQEAISSYLESN